jgi:internalin A
LYENFCKRVTKLYLNFGRIQQVTFLADFTKIRVLYLSSNSITSLAGIEKLTLLEYVCFDKNSVDSLQPLAGLTNLMQISGSENKITSLAGLEGLSKVTILTLYKNEISQINYLENMKLKELSLNNNPIERLENLNHMKDTLEELYIGGTNFTALEPISYFAGLKKLSLDAMKLKRIEPTLLKGLEALVYLSLADNEIEKVENLESEGS